MLPEAAVAFDEVLAPGEPADALGFAMDFCKTVS
jgi:hypothetical protein